MSSYKDTMDRLRQNAEFGDGTPNEIHIYPPVLDLIDADYAGLMYKFISFDNWDEGWDPDDRHDIGVFDYAGTEVMFKVDQTSKDTFRLTFCLPADM